MLERQICLLVLGRPAEAVSAFEATEVQPLVLLSGKLQTQKGIVHEALAETGRDHAALVEEQAAFKRRILEELQASMNEGLAETIRCTKEAALASLFRSA